MTNTPTKGTNLVRLFILLYWCLFWLLNVVDKIIGGAHLLFVGRDRFAQVERFFDSIGLENPVFANIALVITAGLEIFALVFGFLAITLLIVAVTTVSIFYHNKTAFVQRTQAVAAEKITDDTYKIQFPFLAGSTAFEKSLEKFLGENPSLQVDNIYTAPKPLRLGKSDGLIIYIQTTAKQ